MSGKKDQPSTNLLFSPANDLFGSGNTSAFLVPVQSSQSSALMTSESDPAEEDSFLGQNNTSQPPTFALFSGAAGNDPFAAVGKPTPPSGNENGIVTSEHEPQLYVPPSTSATPSPPPAATSFNPGNRYASPPVVAQNIQGMSTVMSGPPPPTQTYMNTHTTRPPYGNSRYVAPPDIGISAPNTATQVFSPGQVPPPPMGGFTSTPYSSPMQNQAMTAPPQSFTKLANSMPPPPPTAESMYHAVPSHWCYSKKLSDGVTVWYPFSYYDSQRLEEASLRNNDDVISTEGGRYDVAVAARERTSVYWEEGVACVRRCTWFAKGDNDHRYVPFEEETAQILEEEYKKVVFGNAWHKQVDLSGGEQIVIHNPQVIVHLVPMEDKDKFGSLPELQMKTRIVKRGIHEIELGKEIPENEIGAPDHLVFVCHGIGPVCDLRSRSIVECVDDFRTIQLTLLKSHFKSALEAKRAHRIEFLPVHWHRALHGDANGVDREIRRLTLPSIQRLRHFTNETLLDILFYSSPVYCQTIAETIGSEINSLHHLFQSRNPHFNGKVSVAGHSLGSLMLFDLLCNQGINAQLLDIPKPGAQQELTLPVQEDKGRPVTPNSTHEDSFQSEGDQASLDDLLAQLNLTGFKPKFDDEQMDMETLILCSESDLKDIGLPMGPRKKLIGYLEQQQKEKEKKQKQLEEEARRLQQEKLLKEQEAAAAQSAAAASLPTRLESVTSFLSSAMNVHVDFQQYDSGTGQPMVKYPQLEFEPEIFFALGSPIGMFLTVRGISDLGEEFTLPTCGRFFNIFHPYDPVAYRIEPLINPELSLKPVQVPHYKGRKRLHLELRDSLGRMGTELKQGIINSVRRAIGSMQKFAQNHWQSNEQTEREVEDEVKKVTEEMLKEQGEKSHENDDVLSVASESSQAQAGFGRINDGCRVDYVLQERPLESFNDYLFAFQSHLCYWNSEDTVLLMMKEIYRSMEVLSDSQIQKLQAMQQATRPPPPIQPYTATPPPPMSSLTTS